MVKIIQPSTYFSEELRRRKRGLATKQNLVATYRFNMYDDSGANLNLQSLKGEFSLPEIKAMVAFREATLLPPDIYYVEATIIDEEQGLIEFQLPAQVRSVPAVYHAEVAIVQSTDDTTFYANNALYVYNEPSHWTDKTYTLLSLDDIRLSLRDSDIIENELIANYDYDVAEISYAVTRAVQFWNETPPNVGFFTTSDFPFRNIWLTGIQLFLYEMIEEHYRRNYLPHSLGGATIDDKNKFQLYRAAWTDRFNRFKSDIVRQKVRMNAEMGSGTAGGLYSYFTFRI